ncbi:MAG: hypothetical protein QW286_01670 [Candidatus Aenigmatarchaeota archaeon]
MSKFDNGKFIVEDISGNFSVKTKKYVDSKIDPHFSKMVFYVEKGVIMTTSYYGSSGFLPSGKLDETSSIYKRIRRYLKSLNAI